MTNKLVEICNTKRQEVAARRASVTFATLDARKAEQSSPRGFRAALDAAARTGHALIAEIKKASPTKGLIRADFDPPAHAHAYDAVGAARSAERRVGTEWGSPCSFRWYPFH